MVANHLLSQLSYAPHTSYGVERRANGGLESYPVPALRSAPYALRKMVGLGGLEPPTSRLSGGRSSRPEL
jgi:hypothetical protein